MSNYGTGKITNTLNFFTPGTIDPNAFDPRSVRSPVAEAAPGFYIGYTTGLFDAATGAAPIRTGHNFAWRHQGVLVSPFNNGRRGAIGNG